MTIINRKELANYISAKMRKSKNEIRWLWLENIPIHYFLIDDLLPEEIAKEIYATFPTDLSTMQIKKSLREHKYVAAQMNKYNPQLEEIIYAFQDQRIVQIMEEITGLDKLEPDTLLYAGGISAMAKDHFLNPHLDNSHDKDRNRYRVLNLLYYVSPDWKLENGGNLELWPDGPQNQPITIESKFNRLVVMVTNLYSWHSVSKVMVNQTRCCVSNYYFSKYSAADKDYFHITSFRGRPEEKIKDLILQADIKLRMFIRKLFPKGIKKTSHYYKK